MVVVVLGVVGVAVLVGVVLLAGFSLCLSTVRCFADTVSYNTELYIDVPVVRMHTNVDNNLRH